MDPELSLPEADRETRRRSPRTLYLTSSTRRRRPFRTHREEVVNDFVQLAMSSPEETTD